MTADRPYVLLYNMRWDLPCSHKGKSFSMHPHSAISGSLCKSSKDNNVSRPNTLILTSHLACECIFTLQLFSNLCIHCTLQCAMQCAMQLQCAMYTHSYAYTDTYALYVNFAIEKLHFICSYTLLTTKGRKALHTSLFNSRRRHWHLSLDGTRQSEIASNVDTHQAFGGKMSSFSHVFIWKELKCIFRYTIVPLKWNMYNLQGAFTFF